MRTTGVLTISISAAYLASQAPNFFSRLNHTGVPKPLPSDPQAKCLRGTAEKPPFQRHLFESGTCNDVASKAGPNLVLLDDGALKGVHDTFDIIDLGSSLPSPETNITALGEAAVRDIEDDKIVIRTLIDTVLSLRLARSFIANVSDLRQLAGELFYSYGNSDTCDSLGECFSSRNIPYGRNHAVNSARIVRSILGSSTDLVNIFASEVSTCWPHHVSSLIGFDKALAVAEQNPDEVTVIAAPYGTAVRDRIDDPDNCRPYESLTERTQAIKDVNPNNVIYAASGTKLTNLPLPDFITNLLLGPLIDLFDFSNSCITPANDPNIIGTSAVDENDRCTSNTWPSLGNQVASVSCRQSQAGLHKLNGEGTSSDGTMTCSAGHLKLLLKARESLPKEAEDKIMEAIFATLDPSQGDCPDIPNFDDAFDYLFELYGTETPSSEPSASSSTRPIGEPSVAPSERPTEKPLAAPSSHPTESPQQDPKQPQAPTENPTEPTNTGPTSDAHSRNHLIAHLVALVLSFITLAGLNQ